MLVELNLKIVRSTTRRSSERWTVTDSRRKRKGTKKKKEKRENCRWPSTDVDRCHVHDDEEEMVDRRRVFVIDISLQSNVMGDVGEQR